MSDRYHGSAYRGRGPPRDDRRYAPRHHHPHHRDEHDYPDAHARPYDSRDQYPPSSYYPDHRGYASERPPRRIHKAIPPPRPWDYSRRPLPRNEEERMALECEREAWEAKEEERYRQRMEERERERDRERGGHGGHGGWDRDYEADERMYGGYDRERARHADHGAPPRRPRSRSPGPDPRYEQRGSWGRASVGSAEGREREVERLAAVPPAERPEASSAYPPRRSPPPPVAPSSASIPPPFDTPEGPRGAPRGPASRPVPEPGFISTPPTGPRASRGGPPFPSPASALRGGREASSSTIYTPASDRGEASSYLSPSHARFSRPPRDGVPPSGPSGYRGGHPSFGRGRRDTNPYDSNFAGGAGEDDAGYRGYGGHPGSSPHENSPFSPSTSTPGGPHLSAPRLSRTSSSQTPTTPLAPTSNNPTLPLASPITSITNQLCPELSAELATLETQRNAFISNYVLGAKRTAIRTARKELKEAELDYATAQNRRAAAEKALEVAKETADAYSLEENRKEELLRLMGQQLQQQGSAQVV